MVDPATAVQTEDPDRIDQLMVGDVGYDENMSALVIGSAMRGEIRVHTPARSYVLATRRRPALIKRWLRWAPLDAGEPAVEELIDTEHGPVGCSHYPGPPRADPSPRLTDLRRLGLPEPYETLDIHLPRLPSRAKRDVVSRLLAPLLHETDQAILHRQQRRRGWRDAAHNDAAGPEFAAAVDSDAFWAGELALLLRTRQGAALRCPAADGEILVAITGGYRRPAPCKTRSNHPSGPARHPR